MPVNIQNSTASGNKGADVFLNGKSYIIGGQFSIKNGKVYSNGVEVIAEEDKPKSTDAPL